MRDRERKIKGICLAVLCLRFYCYSLKINLHMASEYFQQFFSLLPILNFIAFHWARRLLPIGALPPPSPHVSIFTFFLCCCWTNWNRQSACMEYVRMQCTPAHSTCTWKSFRRIRIELFCRHSHARPVFAKLRYLFCVHLSKFFVRLTGGVRTDAGEERRGWETERIDRSMFVAHFLLRLWLFGCCLPNAEPDSLLMHKIHCTHTRSRTK